MNRFAHILFLLTALAPLCAVFGLNRILAPDRSCGLSDLSIFAGAFGLVLLCWGLLRLTITKIESQPLKIKTAKNTDRDILPFLLAYVLPLATHNSLAIGGNVLTILVVVLMAAVLTFRSHLSVANPVVALLGFRFYEVQADNGVVFILLSRRPILSTAIPLTVHQLSDVVFVAHGHQR